MEEPEFSKFIKASDIGSAPQSGSIAANAEQKKALAERFDLPEIRSFTADYELKREGNGILCGGKISADLSQCCSLSGEDFSVQISEDFHIIFVEHADLNSSEEEIELDANDCDLIAYENGRLDIGEAIAQTLYLTLDPYPRGPNAETVAREKGVKQEEDIEKTGALSGLKDLLG